MTSLYEKVLGASFNELPVGLAKFHSVRSTYTCQGLASVKGANRAPIRWLAKFLKLPTISQSVKVNFELIVEDDSETWVRKFGQQIMRSTLREREGYLIERLGPMVLRSSLQWSDNTLKMRIVDASFAFVHFPAWVIPDIVADETFSDNKLHFLIEVRWKWIGTLVGYSGYLDLSDLQEVS